MRLFAVLVSLATPAHAWEFTPGLPCVLRHTQADLTVVLTHDPTRPLFTISLTRPVPWPDEDIFAMRFVGLSGLTISTNRHVLSDGGRTLTVTDTGFGNVLTGLAGNDTALARIGDQSEEFELDGAAGPVKAFRECSADPAV